MIQRIQTIYLLVVALMFSVLFFVPFAGFSVDGAEYVLEADSLKSLTDADAAPVMAWPLFILLCVMVLVPFITIFLYNRRMLQVRMSIFSSVIDAMFYALYFYECYQVADRLSAETTYRILPLLFPVLAIILNVLAIRNIARDEMTIRALNSSRLR